MTRYTVVWDSNSQDVLAEIWMISTNRPAVTAAAHFIGVELSQDASYERYDGRRGIARSACSAATRAVHRERRKPNGRSRADQTALAGDLPALVYTNLRATGT